VKIDIFDGTISFELGSIRRSIDIAQFLESPIGRSAEESLVNENWRHYGIEPEAGVAGTVLFNGDEIDRIFLAMRMDTDDSGEWTVEREFERKAKHEQWLRKVLGRGPYRYPWGRVVSEFDPKGLASEIIIVYER
jgi:hypothetical protein